MLMASTSNPPGCHINHYYANTNIQLDGVGGGGGSLNENVNALAIYDSAGPSSAENLTETPNYLSLIHNPGISVDWAAEEQQVLEELLVRYAADTPFQRYSKIAQALHDKTIRDVAFRCRWMNEMQNRWKDHQSSSKNNEEKNAIATNVLSESYGAQSIIPSNTTLMPPINDDDIIACTMTRSASGLLLQQNAYNLDLISASTDSIIIRKNLLIFHQIQKNIHSVLNDTRNVPQKRLPVFPLAVRLNYELLAGVTQSTRMRTQ